MGKALSLDEGLEGFRSERPSKPNVRNGWEEPGNKYGSSCVLGSVSHLGRCPGVRNPRAPGTVKLGVSI